MKPFMSTKFLAASTLALAAFGAASAAHARSDVYFSFGVQAAPGVYLERRISTTTEGDFDCLPASASTSTIDVTT